MRTVKWYINIQNFEEELGKRGKTKKWMVNHIHVTNWHLSRLLSNKIPIAPPLMDKILCCFIKKNDSKWRDKLYGRLFRIVYVTDAYDNR